MKTTNIKKEIYKTGFTLESFADYVGLNKPTIYNISNKRYQVYGTRGDTIQRIAYGLGKTYEETERIINDCN